MKKTVKVILLSLLVFPGAGHLFLKKYAIAAAFFVSFAYILIGLIKDIHEKTQKIMNSVVNGDIPMDISAITEALIDNGVLNNSNMSTMSGLLLFIWLFSAFDAYRIANKY